MRFAGEAVGASASSLFLVDAERGELRGLVSEWDWTRTSFPTQLTEWPSVQAALTAGASCFIASDEARGAEIGWFETRGITSTLCVPMRGDASPIGVLFFDFDVRTAPLARPEAALLRDVGRRCARAIARAEALPPAVDARWLH